MTTFLVIWFGQLISLVGSGMTGFALGVYIFQQTGATTPLILVWLFVSLPNILVSPLAGPLIDRWNRRWVMLLSDTGAAIGTLVIGWLFFTARLEVWHIYLLAAFNAAFGSFQQPAYAASITLLVPKDKLGRANGLVEFGRALSDILTPLLAGALVILIGLGGVILIDVITFLFAVATLLAVRIPNPEPSAEGRGSRGSLWREAATGWKFVATRPGLLSLMILSATVMVLGGITEVLITPLVLSFSTADVLGQIFSVGGAGFLVGGLAMTVWGGPKRRVLGVIVFEIMAGTATLVMGLRPSVPLIASSVFLLFFTYPILSACEQTIWQTKVSPDIQGRVFSVHRVISWLPLPLALLGTGWLVDRVLEPLFAADGALADSVGRLIGVGPGRGTGLLFITAGALNILAAVVVYLYPRFRHLEAELPDAIADQPTKDRLLTESASA